MSRRATPPATLQFVAIWLNRVVPVRSRVSARQICPVVAVGKSVIEAPPLVSKTKNAVIGEVMSEPALEVVDHVAGIQYGATAQPVAFVGCCGPSESTLFWAMRGATPSSNGPPNKNNILRFFTDFSPCTGNTEVTCLGRMPGFNPSGSW
jgi:hypothetical protein